MTMKNLLDYTINANGRLIDLSEPQVMGILNVTPDSFYAGSRKQSEKEIADRAEQIIREGGSMIDIGAFSTSDGGRGDGEDEKSPADSEGSAAGSVAQHRHLPSGGRKDGSRGVWRSNNQ